MEPHFLDRSKRELSCDLETGTSAGLLRGRTMFFPIRLVARPSPHRHHRSCRSAVPVLGTPLVSMIRGNDVVVRLRASSFLKFPYIWALSIVDPCMSLRTPFSCGFVRRPGAAPHFPGPHYEGSRYPGVPLRRVVQLPTRGEVHGPAWVYHARLSAYHLTKVRLYAMVCPLAPHPF